ncbi:hypothetical protein ACO0QE_003005 [Hanseniaspora vineae]
MTDHVYESRSPTPVPLAQNQNSLIATEYVLKDLPYMQSVEFPLKCKPGKEVPESIANMINMCGGINNIKETFQAIALSEAENSCNENGEETLSSGQTAAKENAPKALELYLNKNSAENSNGLLFNDHPLLGKPTRDQRLILKIKIKRKKTDKIIQKSKKMVDKFQDCVSYTATPIAIVDTTIKFRALSDFQVILDNNRSAKEYDQCFNKLKWENMKSFVNSIEENDTKPFYPLYEVSQNKAAVFELLPPPRFSMVDIPYVYKFKRNPYHDVESNTIKKSYVKAHQIQVTNLETIPTKPPQVLLDNLKVAKETGVYPGTSKEDAVFLKELESRINDLKPLFERQPIWIKKHIDGILSQLDTTWLQMVRFALPFVSYRIMKGPWRNTYCKYGVDPTSDPKYARYQTENFRIEKSYYTVKVEECPNKFVSDTPNEIDSRFFFTGKQIPWYSTYQMFQLEGEPNIKEILDQVVYLDKPNDATGWFPELDLWKIRKIIKYELGCLIKGNQDFSSTKLKIIKEMPFLKGFNPNSTYPKKEKHFPYVKNKHSESSNEELGDAQQTGKLTGNKDAAEEEEDDDNGVDAGNEDMHNVAIDEDLDDDENDDELINDKFDATSASFKEIVQRIMMKDPELGEYMDANIEGLVRADKL